MVINWVSKLRREALQIAYDQDLDLLCVAPKAVPPVCKVLDYGKHRLNSKRKQKKRKRNSMLLR